MHRLTESDFDMTSYVQDGGHDVRPHRLHIACLYRHIIEIMRFMYRMFFLSRNFV